MLDPKGLDMVSRSMIKEWNDCEEENLENEDTEASN